MSHATTVLQQLLHLLPKDRFQMFVGQHRADRYIKSFSCQDQLAVLLYAQATKKNSLREIETGLRSLDSTWYHLGLTSVARSTIAYANEHRSWKIYESLFYALLEKCQSIAPRGQFRFRNALHALDSTVIDVSLSLFPWAKLRTGKGAVKLHTSLNLRNHLPDGIVLTEGRVHDAHVAQMLDVHAYAKGTIFVFDRGYYDFAFLQRLKNAGHHFVMRLKKNACLQVHGEYRPSTGNIQVDEEVSFSRSIARKKYPGKLRRVISTDPKTGKSCTFLTDMFHLSATHIALIYRQRWQIELFFKWIKQHLRITTFLGTSKNAVLTQVWTAMTYFLLVAWIAFQTRFKGSFLELSRILSTILMRRVSLIDGLRITLRTVHRIRERDGPQLSLL